MSRADVYKLFNSGQQRTKWQRRTVSIFLWLCTLAYLGMYIASLFVSNWQLALLKANPLLGPNKDVLIQLGATATYKIQADHEWWRLISSLFMCGGTLHVWATSSAVWTFGLFLSTVVLPWQLISIFFLSGLAGVTASANVAGNFITSAAGGPAFGLIGGTCVCLVLHFRLFVNHIMSVIFLILALGLNLYMGATPFVDNCCNTIGFIAGVLSTMAFLLMNKQETGGKSRECVLRLACIGLLAVTVCISGVCVLGLLIPDKSPVQGCCDKWVCIPSDIWDCSSSEVRLTCEFSQLVNGTTIMYCPQGAGSMVVPAGLSDSGLLALCDSACSGAVASTPSPSPSVG